MRRKTELFKDWVKPQGAQKKQAPEKDIMTSPLQPSALVYWWLLHRKLQGGYRSVLKELEHNTSSMGDTQPWCTKKQCRENRKRATAGKPIPPSIHPKTKVIKIIFNPNRRPEFIPKNTSFFRTSATKSKNKPLFPTSYLFCKDQISRNQNHPRRYKLKP